MRTADEIARQPVGQRDLTSRRSGVEAADQSALDQNDAVLKLALRQQYLRTVELLGRADAADPIAILRAQPVDQTLRSPHQLAVFGEQNSRRACPNRKVAIGSHSTTRTDFGRHVVRS